ncbi:hypothetical protein A6A04_15445 [Paramagnetospirillum marisnigri]|uniref:DUF1641 domain-containing protein n=1 Tax=Paramagnetospirillum marisnigri TaxID=1285242 RepID=A0A178MV37_9PROT|nr:hypothetical protein [Paramagnetospirillum marisnigri]OAN52893.1 hypothetical protein A6A04_15445 [Paramagnetospirillum marisnigri]
MTDTPKTDEMARLAQGLRDALSDSMVERITGTAGNALEVVDKLNEPDVKDGIMTLLDAVGTMHRTGALQTLIDAMFLIHAMRSAATDSMVDRAFAFIEHMANNLGTEDLATLAHEAKGAMEDAIDSCNIPGAGGGLLGTLRMVSQTETQEAMRFMMSFACSLKKRAVYLAKSPQV